MTILQSGIAPGGAGGGYQIERSLRFNSADSTYLSRTPGSAGNRKTWTWSAWIKRSGFTGGTEKVLIQSGYNTAPWFSMQFETNEALGVSFSAGVVAGSVTAAVFRDLSAWYHIVLAVDTTQATAANRLKLYVNNVQQTFASTNYPSQNFDTPVNNTVAHNMGGYASLAGYYFPGYMAEIYLIDGQQLTPSSFGETDSNTGVWKPKQVTGMTYGTNGFYLKFADNSNTTAATLGKDSSGNGNNWTPNNFSVTAGVGNDSLVDTPTPYGTDAGAGGEVRGNYWTMNALTASYNTSYITYSNGNLQVTKSSSTVDWRGLGNGLPSTGKWYWEWTITALTAGDGYLNFGIADQQYGSGGFGTYFTNMYVYLHDGRKSSAGGATSYGSSFTTNDVIGVAYDADAGSITFYKNGTSQGTAYTGISTSTQWYPAVSQSGNPSSGTYYVNFGQRAFANTAPSGYKALCTQNLPTPAIGATSTTLADDYFNIVTYTGDGTDSRSITGVGFAPDLVYIKGRSAAETPIMFDRVRGANKALYTNGTSAEESLTETLDAFGSDGFTVSYNSAYSTVFTNKNTTTYVGWAWNAGGSNATNTNGTITSTVRANTTAGISVVTFTGNGTDGATVGHGLGASPGMVIVKNRSDAYGWMVAHSGLTSGYNLTLESTGAQANGYGRGRIGSYSSTTFTLTAGSAGTSLFNNVNQSGNNYVAYVFAPIAGFSAFGSYTGNASTDGPFVYTGFRPKYVMIKRTDVSNDWEIWDAARNSYNVANLTLAANLADAEYTRTTSDLVDLLSNGFKVRASNAALNASSGGYIYVAFAENPFKYSLAR